MTKLIFFILFFSALSFHAQSDTISILINKGDILLDENQFEQAAYYYKLALRENKNSYKKDIYQNQIEEKIIFTESLLAYSVNNEDYIKLICQADSLYYCCEIEALKAYQNAYSIVPGCNYPSLKIDAIINSSPEIQKKLLVISAKRKRKQYLDDLELANFYYSKNDYIKAYKLFEKISIYYPEDTISKIKLIEINDQVREDLELFEKTLTHAESYFRKEKYAKSKNLFKNALAIDNDCNICKIKLKSIEYLQKKKEKKTDWGKLSKEADENYRIGNYEMAQYQYIWLAKHDPSMMFFKEKAEEISAILEEEVDEKHSIANAKILLERADIYFLAGEFILAKEHYSKIANRYENSIDNLIYVLERIKDCEHYIQENQ